MSDAQNAEDLRPSASRLSRRAIVCFPLPYELEQPIMLLGVCPSRKQKRKALRSKLSDRRLERGGQPFTGKVRRPTNREKRAQSTGDSGLSRKAYWRDAISPHGVGTDA